MLELAEALALLRERVVPGPAELVHVAAAAGRILAEPAVARLDAPPFRHATVDGYAVRAADVVGEARLEVASVTPAGAPPAPDPGRGRAARVATGAPLPLGVDAVVMQEDADVAHASAGEAVRVVATPSAGDGVRPAGDDVAAGEVLLEAGATVAPAALAVLAGGGLGELLVRRRPRVRVLATGAELRDPGASLGPGEIVDSNGPTLAALAARHGAEVLGVGRVRDDAAATRDAVAGALADADVLLVSGGVSVGERDLVRPAIEAAGGEELFWRLRLRPGKPAAVFVTGDGRWVLGLPGNPVSAVCALTVLGGAVLGGLLGRPQPGRWPRVALGAAARPDPRRPWLQSARLARDVAGALVALPTTQQGSGMTAALAGADGFVLVPDGQDEVPAGTPLPWVPLDPAALPPVPGTTVDRR